MYNKYMKKGTTSSAIKEMQIKMTLKFQSEWQSSSKQGTNVGEDTGERNPYILVVGM
jgi:hypothetical protein